MERKTDGERQTERKTDGEKDRWRERQMDGQTYIIKSAVIQSTNI